MDHARNRGKRLTLTTRYLRKHGSATVFDIADALEVTDNMARSLLSDMMTVPAGRDRVKRFRLHGEWRYMLINQRQTRLEI